MNAPRIKKVFYLPQNFCPFPELLHNFNTCIFPSPGDWSICSSKGMNSVCCTCGLSRGIFFPASAL